MALTELQKLMIILGIAIVILVVGFLIQRKMLKKKKEMDLLGGMGGDSSSSMSAQGGTQPSNPQDTEIINYIQQYKSQYSKDSIKQALVGSGKDASRVEELLNKYF